MMLVLSLELPCSTSSDIIVILENFLETSIERNTRINMINAINDPLFQLELLKDKAIEFPNSIIFPLLIVSDMT